MFDERIEIEDPEKYEEPSFPLIDRIGDHHMKNFSYYKFFDCFMTKNVPVLITGIADRWECRNWVAKSKEAESSSINFEYLSRKIDKKQNVPIANCNQVYFNSHEKSEITFEEFLNHWQSRNKHIECETGDLLYLKDWHLRRNQPDYQFYKTPFYFASDWLNEYCDEKKCDDYRFVYMGPKGTWTPFHADVFSSFSWSTNITGTKKWIFFPPNEENQLRDRLGNLPFDIHEEKYKHLMEEESIRSFEVIQRAGQTVFVPSGWHHQVWNLEDTISINHNWFNGCNIHCIWKAMYEKFNEVLREIDDCKDMENFDEHCQLMLKSDFGLDFEMFLDILKCIVANRQKILQNNVKLVVNESELGKRHAIYDLNRIRRVIEDFKAQCSFEELRKSSQCILLQIDDIIRYSVENGIYSCKK